MNIKYISIILLFFISISLFAEQKYTVSNKGKEIIKENENCVLTAYWDNNGYSIGYGHHSKNVYKGMKISKSYANKLFNEDLKNVNSSINRLLSEIPIKHNYSQNFIDGLADLIYNCGENGVRKSEFYNRLKRCRKNNINDFNYTIAAIKTMRISHPGHKERRYKIHKLMLK